MSKCSNCSSSFTGCSEIVSDQCVRYTGIDIPQLSIVNGDTLEHVESKIIEFLLNVSTGDGLIPIIDENQYCTLVKSYLPCCDGPINLNNVLSALIQSVCFTKSKVDELTSELAAINADYSIKCLTGVTASTNTHEILQATIDNLCALNTTVNAVILDLSTNYVKLDELNELIEAYLNSDDSTILNSDKMVPYVAYEYYGPLTNFDVGGAGFGVWEKVYLCNGSNGTPDKRGRVAAGVTTGMGGGSMDPAVNPGGGNPNYTLNLTTGQNNVLLNSTQIPSHTHTAIATSTAAPHSHLIAKTGSTDIGDLTATSPLVTYYDVPGTFGSERFSYTLKSIAGTHDRGPTNNATVDVTTSVTVNATGDGIAHNNIQPTIGAYYIMYIP